MLSKLQEKLHWRVWGAVRKLDKTIDRKAFYAAPSDDFPNGLPESHTSWRNKEFDDFLGRCKAVTDPSNYGAQRKQIVMPETRWLVSIGHVLSALGRETEYAEGIARQMNLHGALGGPFLTLETAEVAGLEGVFIALKKEARRAWKTKKELLAEISRVAGPIEDQQAAHEAVRTALNWERLKPFDEMVYEQLLVVLSALRRFDEPF